MVTTLRQLRIFISSLSEVLPERNLLKHDSAKGSVRQKRFRAAMDNDFLFHLLTQL